MAQVEVNLTDGQKLETITSPDSSYVDIGDDYVYMQSPYKNKKLGKKNKNNKKNNMKFDSIMKKQIGEKEFIPSDQIINEYFVDEDLPQDVLIESLLVSQMQQQQPPVTNDTNINNENTNSKPSEEISSENNNNTNIENVVKTSNVSNVNNDQYLADLLLAMDLQQAEEENFKQRRAHEQIYNGKYTKVRETAPKVTTNDVTFYYDMDEFVNNNNNTNLTVSSNNNDTSNNGDLKSKRKRRRKNKKIENNDNNESENIEENNNNNNDNQTSPDKKPITTKHDPIVWNQKHCQRLKAYEAMGDVNANEMHISNKTFNAIRYRLERKGFTKDPPEMNM